MKQKKKQKNKKVDEIFVRDLSTMSTKVTKKNFRLNRHPIPLCKSFLATDSKVCKRRNGSTSLKQDGDADAGGERRNKRLEGRKRNEVVLGKESKIKWYSQLVLIPRAFDQQACLVWTFLLYYCSTVETPSNALNVNENSPIQQWI